MADGSAVANPSADGASGPNPGNAPRPAQGGGFLQQILQYIVMYLLVTNVFNYFKPKSPLDSSREAHSLDNIDGVRIDKPTEFQTAIMGVNSDAHLPVFPTRDQAGRKLGAHKSLFKKGIELDFYLYITDDKFFNYLQDSDKLVSPLCLPLSLPHSPLPSLLRSLIDMEY
jgi:hypothetical protein